MNGSVPDNIDVFQLSQELKALIRLEDCNKSPDNDLERTSDYTVYEAFITLLEQFPTILQQVIKGQEQARDIDTYKPGPGILLFETTGHAHFLREAILCIKSLLEFKEYMKGEEIYVNSIGLKIFLFNFNKAFRQDVPNHDSAFWVSLGEMLNVTDSLIQELQMYIRETDRNLSAQDLGTGNIARREEQRARYES